MTDLQDTVENLKNTVTSPLPKPPSLHQRASAKELKSRLEWGEPALTILDVREREVYNESHIMGAMPAPLDTLAEWAKTALRPERDIYLYGASDEQTAQAASTLREGGFMHIAELEGGLAAWKTIGGSTEGTHDAVQEPGSYAYNVVSQVSHHTDIQSKRV